MYPANQYMDPYHSCYRNHTPYPYYPPPGWEIPTGHPRAMDSPYRPPTYGPWPYNAGMHHPHPSEFHCCCNHTYPPDYYSFKPPLPQELPPPHLYYHGPFSQHSNAFPSYFFPPHPYPVEQMPYGYDKLKSHCCGCPNHVCHGEEKGNVKIEEERPDLKLESEHKDADSGSIIRHSNNQFPFIWLPPGTIEGKENGKRYELSPHLLNGWVPMSRKMTGDVKQQEEGNQLNGWAPVSSKSTGDVRHQEQDQEKKQFHWPMVWMPAEYDEPKKKAKDMKMEEAPNNSAKAPQSPKIKIIPLSWFDDGNDDQKPANRDGSGDHSDRSVKSRPAISDGMTLEGSPKATPAVPKTVNDERKPARENYKTNPIVPENKIDENKAHTYRTIPVMKESDEKNTSMSGKKEEKKASNVDNTSMSGKKEEKKASNVDKVEGNGKTKHSESSTAKHSKLPPVCLRVDPFPRKKSGNGSRSPSPPTRKDGDKAKKDVKKAQGRKLEPKQSDARHIAVSDVKEKSDVKEAQGQKLEPKQSDARRIAVSDVKEKSPNEMKKGVGLSNETVQAASLEHSWEEEVPTSKDDRKAQASSTTIGTQENSSEERFKGCDENKNEDVSVVESEAAKDDARTRRANLSEPDAAVRIQSAYRGYDVRRWQPLDKLRKIRNVNEQMEGVKEQLKCIEDSFKKPTEKEQVAIGETIMNLLLKLDTIQGLHPSVRDARKSVARELVCLQEKLDTLCKQPSGESDHTNSNDKSEGAENISRTVAPTISIEACDKEERAVDLGKVEGPSSVDLMEPSDAVPTQIPMEVKQDADASEHKNEKEESYSTRIEEENKGKAPGQFELQVPLDMVSDLPEHPTGIHEHKIEESNAVSVEQVTEQKPAVEGEGKEVLVMNSTELSHDAASAGDSNGLKQCTVSTEQTLHSESNTRQSSAFTEDINGSSAAASVESGVATEKDGPVEGQLHGTVAEKEQQRELRSPVVHLEESSLSLQGEEQHDLIPADDSMSYTKDQSEEARDISMQDQAITVNTMQDSRVKEPDGTPEASMSNIVLSPSAEPDSAPEQTFVDESNHLLQCVVSGKDEQPHEGQKTEATVDMLTGGSASDGDSLEALKKEYDTQESRPNLEEETNNTRDEIVLPELDSCELSCAHEGRTTRHERSDEMEVSLESQTDTQEDAAVGLPDTDRCIEMLEEPSVDADTQEEHADVVLPETGECTETLKEVPVDTAKLEEHADVALPETGECIETLKEASATNSAEDVAVQVSVTEECTAMPENSAEDGVQASVTEENKVPENAQMGVSGANSSEDADVQVYATEKPTKDAPVRAAGLNAPEDEAHNLKEDITENQISEAALSADGRTDDDPHDGDKKKLAEENQQLKELLQKLLASGNDQMGVITDLSDKVKALERKLARKKRPKVRVHRPARNATARVH